MLAPISYVFGIPADRLSAEFSFEEILPMFTAANDFLRLVKNPIFDKVEKPQPKPEYNEFSARFGQYKGVNQCQIQ